MSRDRANGKSNQQSGAPSNTSLEQAETVNRRLLDRVRDTLTRRSPSRAHRTVEGLPSSPRAPYTNTEEAETIEHGRSQRHILAQHLHMRRRENEQRRISQQIAEEFAQLPPLRASTFPFFGTHSLASTSVRPAGTLWPADLPSRPGRQSIAASGREGVQDRGPALLSHLTRRDRLLAAQSEPRSLGPSEGDDGSDATPPPPYVQSCHRGRSQGVEELVELANSTVRPPSRRAARRRLAPRDWG